MGIRGDTIAPICKQSRTDCFAYCTNGQCRILNDTTFNKPCPFYKEESIMRPYYADYVRHCLRFYFSKPDLKTFKTEIDRANWEACHQVYINLPVRDQNILKEIYADRDTIADSIYKVSEFRAIEQDSIWQLLNRVERAVAKKRGLV